MSWINYSNSINKCKYWNGYKQMMYISHFHLKLVTFQIYVLLVSYLKKQCSHMLPVFPNSGQIDFDVSFFINYKQISFISYQNHMCTCKIMEVTQIKPGARDLILKKWRQSIFCSKTYRELLVLYH